MKLNDQRNRNRPKMREAQFVGANNQNTWHVCRFGKWRKGIPKLQVNVAFWSQLLGLHLIFLSERAEEQRL